MKKIVLLGATGSIGTQTVDVCLAHPDQFKIIALSAGKNIEKLKELLSKLNVKEICVSHKTDAEKLSREFPDLNIFWGEEGLIHLATLPSADVVVNALVGFAGLTPTLKAIKAKKDIALANKETLVVAGEIVMKACREEKILLTPIDSEHSAIFQCLQGNKIEEVKRLIITASGGSFRNLSREECRDVTVEQALAHPNWLMGEKITIDCATMMNKGFEVMEAHWLFGLGYDQIDVLIHEESIVHSMIEYRDHAMIAQMGTADMKLPIQYALAYPHRLELFNSDCLNLEKVGTLHFRSADSSRYPLLALAYQIGKMGGNMPAVLNAANEVANLAFRERKIGFLDIEDIIIKTCQAIPYKSHIDLEDIYEADRLAREKADEFVKGAEK